MTIQGAPAAPANAAQTGEREVAPSAGPGMPSRSGNREGLSRYALRWKWVTGPSESSFTAVLRVKNEARSLPWVLPGILRSVQRVVLVDNGSTDDTPEVAERIATESGLAGKLDVISYPFAVSRCGPEHLWTHPESVHSLTYFYNWSFSHVRTRYALKWDGDMVLTPQGERVLRDLAWQLQGVDGTVKMRRSPVYVENERVAHVDLAIPPGELWGWRNSPDHTFVKCFDWEFIRPWADYLLQLPDWVCFELKWLDRDQFGHWSRTDFQNLPHSRKRREWQVNRALHEGVEPPKGVVRVESPKGTHVVDHLRQTYTTLRRQNPTGALLGGPVRTATAGPPPERGPSPVPEPTKNEEIPYE